MRFSISKSHPPYNESEGKVKKRLEEKCRILNDAMGLSKTKYLSNGPRDNVENNLKNLDIFFL